MSRKGTPKKAELGPSAIAREAGISKQLASRKLKQGKTPNQIVAEAARRHDNQAAKSFPARANGQDIPPFAESQAVKEAALAALREHELKVKRREVYRAVVVDRFVSETIVRVRDRFLRLPSELRDNFDMRPGPEVEGLLDREIRAILSDLSRLENWRSAT